MSEIVGYLEELDILDEEKLERYVWETDIRILHGLVMYLRQLIDKEYKRSKYSPFVFMPSGEISGAGGCNAISCKMRRATTFASFSALYADRVFLQLDFITSEHMDSYDIEKMFDDDENWYRDSLHGDLAVISVYSELLKCKLVCIVPSKQSVCPECFQRAILGKQGIYDFGKIKREYEKVAKIILNEFDGERNEALVQIRGADEFFPNHEALWVIDDIKGLGILKKEIVGNPIKNKEYARNLIGQFIESELALACYLARYCKEQEAKLITNKVSDAMFLGINDTTRTMREAETYLSMIPEFDMPLIGNLKIADVLRLRESESESFERYRVALKAAITEQLKCMDDTNIYQIYDDIIYPEFIKLDAQMKKAKSGRLKMLFGGMTLLVSSLVVNKYGNIAETGLFSEMNDLESAILNGGVGYAFSRLGRDKTNPKENDYYFLWKLKNRIV